MLQQTTLMCQLKIIVDQLAVTTTWSEQQSTNVSLTVSSSPREPLKRLSRVYVDDRLPLKHAWLTKNICLTHLFTHFAADPVSVTNMRDLSLSQPL
jgi:hypothetical protein